MTADATRLLAAFEEQVRVAPADPLPAGHTITRDGPVFRARRPGHEGMIEYRSVAALAPDDLDALIARQRDASATYGESIEWKYYHHDEPADLPARLIRAGFQPRDAETVLVAITEEIATTGPAGAGGTLPDGIRIIEATSADDLARIAAMESEVWDTDRGYLPAVLAAEKAADPAAITVLLAETADGTCVSAGWVRFTEGTEFASIWGGATLAAWRGRGIFRALVAARAGLAARRGFRYLQVDASDASRPILGRLGFVEIARTTPYVWTPPGR